MSVHRISTASSHHRTSSQTSHTSHTSQVLSSDDDQQEDARLLVRTRPTLADLDAYTKETHVPSPTSSQSSSSHDVINHQHPLHHLITHDNTNASIMICELFTAQCACLWFGLVLIAFGIYVILQYQCLIPFRPYTAYAVTELLLLPISLCLLIGAFTHFHKLRYVISTTTIYALPLLIWLLLFILLPIFGWLLFTGVLTPPKRSIAAATPILIDTTGMEHASSVLPDPRNGSCPNLDTSTTITMAYIMNGIHSFFLLLFFIGCCHPRWNSSESIYASYSYHGEDTVEAKRRIYHEHRNTPRKPPTEPSWFAPYKKTNTPPSPQSPPQPISKSLARTTSMGDFIGTHPRQSSQIDPSQIAKILEQQAEEERKAIERTIRREKRKDKKKRQSTSSRGSRHSLTAQASLDNVVSVLSQESPGNDTGGILIHTPSVLITVNEGADMDEDPGTHHSPGNDHYSLAPPMPERSVSASSSTSSIGEFSVPLAISVIPPTPEQSPEIEHISRSPSPMPQL